MELYLYGIGTGIMLLVMVVFYAIAIRICMGDNIDAILLCMVLFLIPAAILTPLSIYVIVKFIYLVRPLLAFD
jgi:hypothetical protein